MTEVTVGLYGGIGNQLFQYAMGLGISTRNGVPLVLDTYGFEFDSRFQRHFALGAFQIGNHRLVVRPGMFRLARILRRVARTIPAVQAISRPWFVVEATRDFDEKSANVHLRRPVYVMGYWQDERYLQPIQSLLRKNLRLKGAFSEDNERVAERIRASRSVAVHCRRFLGVNTSADMASRVDAEAERHSLRAAYYENALQVILERVANPHFFVFSDDALWARRNLKADAPMTFLETGRGPDHEDLVLMGLCQHHVIANSSFSWWGAWLGGREGQVVVAPANAPQAPNLPDRWIQR